MQGANTHTHTHTHTIDCMKVEAGQTHLAREHACVVDTDTLFLSSLPSNDSSEAAQTVALEALPSKTTVEFVDEVTP